MEKLFTDFSFNYHPVEVDCYIEEPHEELCKEYFDENKLIVAKFCDAKFVFSDGYEYPDKGSYGLTICLQRLIDKYGYNNPIPFSIFNSYIKGEIK